MIKAIIILLIGLLALTGYFISGNLNHQPDFKAGASRQVWLDKNSTDNNILVTRVVDGDTLVLEDGKRVRLIGIDTPEIHESAKLYRDAARSGRSVQLIKQLGQRSFEFTQSLVVGKRVRLEFDVEKYDRYKRILAYVYLEDGTFVNAKIVEDGYASLMTYPPNVKHADLFLKLYQQARQERRGLWQ